ncbi:hypothetical protein M408DRAFT_104950 [Serendipita vermifera MAFF 305830]|uniref:Dicer-like protein 1 n=1 Tax=Serendipita vermifera MAFF 305830 TaxID=933852 RepID=A0A0C2W4F4_SERVB|nr:hypothetical protein M408DRAFT_104950 [Serendipita vermifera MAFF 305830]
MLCKWACRQEEARPGRGTWKRVAVIIVGNDTAVGVHSHALSDLLPELSVVGIIGVEMVSQDDKWLQMMGNDILIMTHAEFKETLEAGIIAFSQISLLVIDQPNLALLASHPLSSISSALSAAPNEEKPRLLGLLLQHTTDGTFEFSIDHRSLELRFESTFHGISEKKRMEVEKLAEKPCELVVRFSPPSKVVDTALCKHLRTFDKKGEIYGKEFKSAKAVLREVGSFASDWIWRRALKTMDEHPMDVIFEEEEDLHVDSAVREAKIRQDVYRTIKNWTFTMPNLDPTSRGFNVSPKIAKLVQVLQCFQKDGDNFRGIVFVRRRITALAIVEVLKTISEQLPFIRVEALTGPWLHDSLKQSSIVEDFKAGICNLLIATRIAEDGVEIPPCTCVIRYDIFDSSVSYAHTRSLANGKECHLILMLDKNADVGRQNVRHIARMPDAVKEWTQRVAARREGAYPPPEILQKTQVFHSDSEDDAEETARYIKDPTMSGKIYPQDAVDVIYRYISKLPTKATGDIRLQPIFTYSSPSEKSHICTVRLPPDSPISIVQGPASVSKTAARRAACFETCKQLHDLGLLSYKFFPRPKEVARRLRPIAVSVDEDIEQTKGDILPTLPPAPAPPNLSSNTQQNGTAQPKAQGLAGTRCYKRKFPEFWKNAVEADRNQFYPTIVTVDRNHNPQKPYRPVLLITSVPLPSIGDFQLFFATMPSITYLRPALPMEFDKDQLALLHRYTIRAMRGILNKGFMCPVDAMPFFLAPLDFGWDIEMGKREASWPFPDVSDYIPWDLIVYAAEQHLVPLRIESLESLEEDIKDAVVQDWWTEYTRRYDCMRVRADLNPLTPLESLVRVDAKLSNLVDYCKAKRKGFEGLVDYGQPLIEVSNLPGLINRLSPTGKTFTAGPQGVVYTAKFVIPELCSKFTIPASTMRTLTLLPSIMKKVDDTLLVRELNAMYFDNEIDESALHAAITAPSANVEVDYERLELLGDAYLKYLSSIYLFVTNPTQHEGILHIARQKIISNKALLVNADKSGLPQYIQSKPFMPKLWAPMGYSMPKAPLKAALVDDGATRDSASEIKKESPHEVDPDTLMDEVSGNNGDIDMVDTKGVPDLGKGENLATTPGLKKALYDEEYQWLGDKCVADVAEAIIGAAFQTAGPELALKVVKSLHLPLPFIESWEDFSLKAKVPPPDITVALDDNVLETVEVIVGARFHRPHILAQALTHTSVRGNDMICYERLEFLGDAILDFLVIRHIFDLHGRLSPGALTLLKGAMVSNSVLAAISVHYGLHQFLKIESASVKKAIDQYIPEVEEKQRAEYAAAKEEGRPCGQYWLDVDPPKSIADVVESILGALYVSDGFKLTGAQAMYDALLRPFYDQHISLKTLSHHPTKILFELFQSRGCQDFEITKQMDEQEQGLYRCEVVVHDVILAGGVDPAPTFAARRASFEALDALEGDPQFMDRLCDCRAKAEQRKAAKRAARAQLGKAEAKQALVASEDEEDIDS